MADDVVIRADEPGKKHLIGHLAKRERYIALRDELIRDRQNLWRKTVDMPGHPATPSSCATTNRVAMMS